MKNKNNKLFSKALFKQSIKANGIMWIIITAAVCFMLACVMLISGTSSISSIKENVETTIIEEAIKSSVKKKTINSYDFAYSGMELFDVSFNDKFDELNTMTNAEEFITYKLEKEAEAPTKVASLTEKYVSEGIALEDATEKATLEVTTEIKEDISNKFIEMYVKESYTYAVGVVSSSYDDEILLAATSLAKDDSLVFDELIEEEKNKYVATAKESILGAIFVTINPNNLYDSIYEEFSVYGEVIPEEYINEFIPYMQDDISSYQSGSKGDSLYNYINSSERKEFIKNRGYNSISMLISSKMTSDDVIDKLLNILSGYGVTRQTYDNMNFDYNKVHKISYEASLEYQEKLSYEISLLDSNNDNYDANVTKIKEELGVEVAGSLLEKLPTDVSDGIEELGKMDLYGLIVGSIFFKMAGLLLPIIYLIMVSNNLIAGQVDTGSMAYVLSTSVKRKQVTFTQALYLILSLFLMCLLTMITSFICFGISNVDTNLTYGKLALINLGAFIVLFALSGINFFTSCYFDRSKKAMALGGGISMFFLVATMLGLFGSPVIPSVVRISALNYFNYVSIISLFDVVSMLDLSFAFIYKLVILVVIGLLGYILGSLKFKKKDLPL